MTVSAIEVQSKINIDQKQIADVVIYEAEEMLTQERDRLTEELNAAIKAETEAKKDLTAVCKAEAESYYTKNIKALGTALSALQKGTMTSSYNGRTAEKDGKLDKVCIEVRSEFKVDHYSSKDFSFSDEIKPSTNVRKKYNLFNATIAQKTSISEELVIVKKKLKDIPRLQRKAMGRIASNEISNTSEGKAMLTDLRKNIIKGDKVLKQLSS